jgi:prepilin-type N-terminal cleavage/methylation domain-containing protein
VLSRLRHDEDGFTLMELLMSMALGGIVLTAVMTIFVNGLAATGRVTDRVEAAQRARLAMDRVVTLLNSETCLYNGDGTTQPPLSDAQDTQVTFIANLGLVSSMPSKYRVRYDATSKTLYEERWDAVADTKGNISFPTQTSSRQLATDIVPTSAGAPIFTYFQFNTDGTINTAPMAAGTGMTAANRLLAVRVGAAFAAQPERTKKLDLSSTSVQGVGTVGSAEGSDPSKGVNC